MRSKVDETEHLRSWLGATVVGISLNGKLQIFSRERLRPMRNMAGRTCSSQTRKREKQKRRKCVRMRRMGAPNTQRAKE